MTSLRPTMNSSNITFAPVLVKSHSSQTGQHYAIRRPHVPHRPATSPTLPSPPVPPKDTAINRALKETASAEHRWSEVVPPATALTFAAIWDPEDGLVTFSGAALSASENGGSNISPEDADSRSQVLSVDFVNVETTPNTAKDSLFPYSQSRFAASEISTLRFPVSPTRRSSAGTGVAIDTSVCPEIEKQRRRAAQIAIERGRDSNARRLDTSIARSRKHLVPRAMHHHSSSQDSTTSNGLAALGSSLYNAFRRVATPKQGHQGHSRAERYAFLRRTNGKVNEHYSGRDDHDEKAHAFADEHDISTPPKSPRFRSIFARSIWHRGTGREEGLVCRPRIQDDCDGITLDSGFDCIDIDDGTEETWLANLRGTQEELDSALQRDVNRLKSTFSWTTTSTSRYIDVAAYLEDDSDTDSTVSSLGAPIAPAASHFDSQQAKTTPIDTPSRDCNSPWFPIEPPTPRPGFTFPQNSRPQRNLLRKASKTQVACPQTEKAGYAPKVAKAGQDLQRHQNCSECQLHSELCEFEAREVGANQRKGKGRANSQPDPPDSIRNTVCLGRPAPLRSSSTPASLTFTHTRSQSLPGSNTATPAEVLARASYNHEWATPVPSRPISHVRSPSAPQQGSSLSTMSVKRPTTPTRTCQQFADMRDILRGVQSGIRPSTPIPGMPPVPKNRPPPTSFRPVSAGGRERGRSGTPTSLGSQPLGRWSQAPSLGRSHSHRPLAPTETPSSMRSRTRSLESLRGTAQALAAVSTAPLRSLWRARSFMRPSHSDQPRPSETNDEDGVWVCVDIKSPNNKPKTSSSSDGAKAAVTAPSAFVFTSHPYRDASC